jgi:putative endopeptidase
MNRRPSIHAVGFASALLACAVLQPVRALAQEQAPATDAVPEQVHFGTWGVDLSARDLSVRPGDDFQRHASGHWMDTHDIPADKSQTSLASELNDRNQEQLQAIVTGAPADSQLGAF